MPYANYLEQMPSDVTIGLRNFVDWLTGSTRGITNGGGGTAGDWAVIEADDLTVRETPSGGTGLANLGASNLWRTGGTMPDGAWCVVEGPGTYGNPIQAILRVHNNTVRIGMQMIPLADWATGGGSTASPTTPATIVPAAEPSPPANLTTDGWLIAVQDEGLFVLFYDNKSTDTQNMWLIGECDVNATDLVDDPRPFVYWNDDNDPLDGDDFYRLSPVDDTTVLGGSVGQLMAYCTYNVLSMFTGDPRVAIGNRQEYTCGVSFSSVSHAHDVGRLRYLTLTHDSIGSRGTMTSDGGTADDRLVINANNTDAAILVAWDGTGYP